MTDDSIHPTLMHLSDEEFDVRLIKIQAAQDWKYSDYPKPIDSSCKWTDSEVKEKIVDATSKCFGMEWADSYYRLIELEKGGGNWILPYHGRLALASFNRPLSKSLIEGALVRAQLCMESAPSEVSAYCAMAVGMFETECPYSALLWLRLAKACHGIPSQLQLHVIDFLDRWTARSLERIRRVSPALKNRIELERSLASAGCVLLPSDWAAYDEITRNTHENRLLDYPATRKILEAVETRFYRMGLHLFGTSPTEQHQLSSSNSSDLSSLINLVLPHMSTSVLFTLASTCKTFSNCSYKTEFWKSQIAYFGLPDDSAGLTVKNHLRRCNRIATIASYFGELIKNPWSVSAELRIYDGFFRLMQGTRWIHRYQRSFNASKCGDIWGHLMHEIYVVASTDCVQMRSINWVCSQVDLIRVIVAPLAGSPFSAPSAHFNVACKLLSYLALHQGQLGSYSRKRMLDMQVIQLLNGYLGDASRYEEGMAPFGGPAMSPSYSLVVQRQKKDPIITSSSKRSSSFIRRPSSTPSGIKKSPEKMPSSSSPSSPPSLPSYSQQHHKNGNPSISNSYPPTNMAASPPTELSAIDRISKHSTPGKRAKLVKDSPDGQIKLKLDVLACLSPPRTNRHVKLWKQATISGPQPPLSKISKNTSIAPRTPSMPIDIPRDGALGRESDDSLSSPENLVSPPTSSLPPSISVSDPLPLRQPISLVRTDMESDEAPGLQVISGNANGPSNTSRDDSPRLKEKSAAVYEANSLEDPDLTPPSPPPPSPIHVLMATDNASSADLSANVASISGALRLQDVMEGISSLAIIPDFSANSDISSRIDSVIASAGQNIPFSYGYSSLPKTLREMCAKIGIPYRRRIFGPYHSKYDAEEAELTEAQDSMAPMQIDDFWATISFLHAILSCLGHTSNLVDRIVLGDLNYAYNIDEPIPRPPGATREYLEQVKEQKRRDRILRLEGAWYLTYVPTNAVVSSEFINECLLLLKVNQEAYRVEGVGIQWRIGLVQVVGSISRETGLLEALQMNLGTSLLQFTAAQLRAFNFGGIFGGSYHSCRVINTSTGSTLANRTFGGSWMVWKALAESTNPTLLHRMKDELLAKGEYVSVKMAPFAEDMARLGLEFMQPHFDQVLLWSRVLQKIVHPQLLTKQQIEALHEKMTEMGTKYPASRLRKPSSALMRIGGDTSEKLDLRISVQSIIEPSIHAMRMQLAWFYGPYIDVDIEQLRRWSIKRALDRYYAWKSVNHHLKNRSDSVTQSTPAGPKARQKEMDGLKSVHSVKDVGSEMVVRKEQLESKHQDSFSYSSMPSIVVSHVPHVLKQAHLATATAILGPNEITTDEEGNEISLDKRKFWRRGERLRAQRPDLFVSKVDPEEMLRRMDQQVLDRGEKTDRQIFENLWRCGIDPFSDNAFWSGCYPTIPFDERAVPETIQEFSEALRVDIGDDRSAQFWASILHHTARKDHSTGGEEVDYEPILQSRDVDFMIAEWNRRLNLCHVSNTTDPRLTYDTILAYLVALRADSYIDTEQVGERYFGAEWDFDAVEPKRDSSIAMQGKFLSRKVKAYGVHLVYPDLRPNFPLTANAILNHPTVFPLAKLDAQVPSQDLFPSNNQIVEMAAAASLPRPKTPTLPPVPKPTSISVHLQFTKLIPESASGIDDSVDRDEDGDPEDFFDSAASHASLGASSAHQSENILLVAKIEALKEARRRSIGGEPPSK